MARIVYKSKSDSGDAVYRRKPSTKTLSKHQSEFSGSLLDKPVKPIRKKKRRKKRLDSKIVKIRLHVTKGKILTGKYKCTRCSLVTNAMFTQFSKSNVGSVLLCSACANIVHAESFGHKEAWGAHYK